MMNEQLIYRLLADTLAKIISDGVKMKNVSHETGLSSSTLYKFMRQDTSFPRFHTVVAVLEYLGYSLQLSKGKANVLRTEYQQNKQTSSRLL